MPSDGTAQHPIVGPDLRAGHMVQLFIPGNTFHTARLIGKGQWFLCQFDRMARRRAGGCGEAAALAKKFPAVAEQIRTWPIPVR